MVVVCWVIVAQVLPLRRCNRMKLLVSGAPLAVSLPVMVKAFLTWADEGAEMVRVVVEVLASTAGAALQNNNTQTTRATATTITPFFSANISPHLGR